MNRKENGILIGLVKTVATIDERTRSLKDGDTGDIPEIKECLKGLSGKVTQIEVKHGNRLTRLEVILGGLTGSGVLVVGIIAILLRLLGVY